MTEAPITVSGCGGCTMCCKLMAIPELAKPAGSWCLKCDKGVGCGDYDGRPESCRGFECVWLQSQHSRHGEVALPAAARPDRCRVVIDVRTTGDGLVMHVDPDRPDAYKTGIIGSIVGSAVARGEEVAIVIGSRRRMIRRGT